MTSVYCDESVWAPVAEGLRQRGWTVKTASEEGMLGEPDREQLRFAVSDDHIFLTFDDDFLGLVEEEGMEHSGIIYVDQAGRRIGDIVKQTDKHLRSTDPTDGIYYI